MGALAIRVWDNVETNRHLCGPVASALAKHQLGWAIDVTVILGVVRQSARTSCTLVVAVTSRGGAQTCDAGSATVDRSTPDAIDVCVETVVDSLLP